MSGYGVVNALGCLLIVTSILVVLARTPRQGAYTYGVQSFVLILCFIALGFTTGSTELFTWAGTAFVTKVILVPAVILFTLHKMGNPNPDLPSTIGRAPIVILASVEVLICWIVVSFVQLPAADAVKPALSISLAHFFIGITCLVSQRNILKQVFGYCLMENGSHLTLALLAPTAPRIVEIGIATDAVFAVIIMAVMVYRIYTVTKSLDTDDLMQLKG